MSDPLQVLFLFPGNSRRIQMATGIVNHDFAGKITAVSAGTEPHGLNPLAVQVMHEIGIDISRNSSDHLSRYEGQAFDDVTSLCDSNKTKSVNELVPKAARISSSGRWIQLMLQGSLALSNAFPRRLFRNRRPSSSSVVAWQGWLFTLAAEEKNKPSLILITNRLSNGVVFLL